MVESATVTFVLGSHWPMIVPMSEIGSRASDAEWQTERQLPTPRRPEPAIPLPTQKLPFG